MIALILIKPGPLRDGMDALLVSIAEVHLVAHPNDAEAALDFCEHNITELIVLEVKPGQRDMLNIVGDMKALCPQGNVLALIHDENDRVAAERAQADLILSAGMPAYKLNAAIKALANSSVEESE